MSGPLDTRLLTALGARVAPMFERAFGMETLGDLLAHYPRRYAVRGDLTPLDELRIGDSVVVVAEVRSIQSRQMRQRRGELIEVVITDGTATLQLTFFSRKSTYGLKPGMRAIFAGKVGAYRGTRQLAHPVYEAFPGDLDTDSPEARAWAEAPIPIYPATSTLDGTKIRAVIRQQLDVLGPLDDPVPAEVRERLGLLGFREALERIHRPAHEDDIPAAEETLRFHEALILQTTLLRRRAEHRARSTVARQPGKLSAEFDAALPFPLTGDQRAVGEEIVADLASGVPMNRLVQGEVGSGKTLVALRAMLAIADSGGQSAFLAPTEVLAAQHLRSLTRSLGPDLAARLRPTLLTGQLPVAERRRALLAAASGGASIVVGTHALLGDQVQFADLGLVVVDEQHRFGVDQREALRLKGQQGISGADPHVLVLTATPIPRTVAMTAFGDLDVSTITELPAGRAPITSHVVGLAEHPGWIARVWERLDEEIAAGRQGFVVCPAIDATSLEQGAELEASDDADPDGSDAPAAKLPPAAVLAVIEELRRHPLLSQRRLAVLHGRMSSDEKDATMRAFAAGQIDVLVATTVIEVGVDVPNASTMVVLDADRFGIAQLHQLRGRVGRGGVPGLCLFVTQAEPVSIARERVDAVAETLDGFELARIDLELRREGDVLGGTQSGGRSSLKLLRVSRHADTIEEARRAAEAILADDPDLTASVTHVALREAIDRRLDESERAFLGKS